MSFNIIIKKYDHYNRSLGKHIRSKKHYKEEMRKGRFVSFEEGEEQVAQYLKKHKKPYTLDDKVKYFLNSVKQTKDGKGNVKLGDKALDFMREMGVNFYDSNLPSHYKKEGGFE